MRTATFRQSPLPQPPSTASTVDIGRPGPQPVGAAWSTLEDLVVERTNDRLSYPKLHASVVELHYIRRNVHHTKDVPSLGSSQYVGQAWAPPTRKPSTSRRRPRGDMGDSVELRLGLDARGKWRLHFVVRAHMDSQLRDRLTGCS